MRRMKRAALAATAALVLTLLITPGVAEARDAAACTWTQATLPPPAGLAWGYVTAAANGGWVAGGGSTGGGIRWHNGVAEDLGRVSGLQVDLHDINSAGTAVGATLADSFERDAVIYRDGRFTALPVPPGRRSARALAINDAGDVVGTALGLGDNFTLTLWPATAPGTVLTINPDPAVYGYVSPVGIDEQGRILIRAEGPQTDFFVRYPDGTMTKLALGTEYVSGFRNGRIAGEKYENDQFTTVEWDLSGAVVRTLDTWAIEPVVDSGTRTAGTYLTADGGEALGVWESGTRTDTLATSPSSGRLSGPVITDDGIIATTIGATPTTFRYSCPA
ncbi:hypothetical protein SAMN05421837_102733 [Amycolatopsis pretoriensis]|uniref:Extracellular repeat, HAF family n=2 Tax=Amycolatopsis pretoriensis TaxID=218821 RepID=A0A1H5QEL4_9PSEU|nr:hypothetical protein SAMN05421837_102733 [Amycolatopsis pretoriensis]